MALRILLAPDKFKGTLDATSVAAAMAAGVHDRMPGAEVRLHPLADGGEGTLDCIAASVAGTFVTLDAEDAFGAPVTARAFDDGRTAMIAMHETARLPARPNPSAALRASSYGTGRALAAVLDRLPGRDVVVFVGGSASTDGGAGAAQAAGWRLLDAGGRELPRGGGALRALASIEPPPVRLAGNVVGACDVRTPLLGPAGAAAVFAPQKGAGPAEVRVLADGLANLADRLRSDVGVEVGSLEGAGAGGGMGAGLAGFFGAALTRGFDLVASVTSLDADVEWADLVVTGEGCVDDGTLGGKVVARVAEACAAARTPCAVVTGEVRLRAERLPARDALAVASLIELVAACGRAAAFEDPRGCVRNATGTAAAAALAGG